MLKLWEYVEEVVSGKYRELAPLLVMLVEQPDEQILQRERELILAEPDAHKQADLLALAVAIASRNFDSEFLRFVFRKELEQMQGATLLDEWIGERVQQQVAAQVTAQVAERLAKASEQAREQGMQQGKELGKLEQQREIILHTLQLRFPSQANRLNRLPSDWTWSRACNDLNRFSMLRYAPILGVNFRARWTRWQRTTVRQSK